MITIRFTCGHTLDVGVKAPDRVQCLECGCEQIERVNAPKPRFRGACSGPCAVEEKP